MIFMDHQEEEKQHLQVSLQITLKEILLYVQDSLLVRKSDILTIFANLKDNNIIFMDEFIP